MCALRDTPPSDPVDLVSSCSSYRGWGEERSAYSSDKVVKFGVRGVSMGSSADLKLACLNFNICQIMEFVGQATVLGALIPRCCRNFRSSPLLRVSRTFSVIYCALKRSLGLALPREASCSTSPSKPGFNLLLL